MQSGHLSPLIGYIRRIVTAGGDATDGQLLERFAARGEEPAFAALMHRHGPMVLDVCRRVLGDAHEAEDAFQATFLVLVRKAGSIGRPELLGHWLYGVAYRTALKAKAGAARRRAHERQVIDMPATESVHDVVWRDLRPVLDEEVNRLAAHYRVPFVLCCLEGRTKEEAACQLGLPEGTVSSRLARAREQLRTRLARRGIVLSTGLLFSVLADNLSAAVPTALAHSTLNAAVLAAAGEAAVAGVVSAQVAALTKGVLQAVLLTKLKIAAVVFLTVTLMGAGFGAATYRTRAGGPADEPADGTSGSAARGTDKADADRTAIQGTWVVEWGEADGRPLAAQDRAMKWAITADHITYQDSYSSTKLTYRLDPAGRPRAIDMKGRLGLSGGGTMRGIYLLERNRLKLCYAMGARERPDDFVTSRGSERILLVLRRRPLVRDRQEPPKNDNDAPDEESAKNDKEAIQGTWVMVYNEASGQRREPQESERKWVIGPENINTSVAGSDRSLTYRLDPTTTPKRIDLQHPQMRNAMPGIYMLTGNRLVLCITVAPQDQQGAERPTDFAAQLDSPQTRRTLWVFRRARAANETAAQARHRLQEEKAQLEQTLKQTATDIEALKGTIADLKRRKAEEDAARAQEEAAKAQEEAELGRLTVENVRLREQLERLANDVEQLKKEQRSLESPARHKRPAGN
ncbi:MAG TPA: sigma-70 family RNA polymerase sigma factor [Gemmataceae bacterium]|jgi:RNA polymerase sigma factor (sigma-70 family)|nr:sigma-70 family RNA polymerase sigma factor [Gemmataceae bacterium]